MLRVVLALTLIYNIGYDVMLNVLLQIGMVHPKTSKVSVLSTLSEQDKPPVDVFSLLQTANIKSMEETPAPVVKDAPSGPSVFQQVPDVFTSQVPPQEVRQVQRKVQQQITEPLSIFSQLSSTTSSVAQPVANSQSPVTPNVPSALDQLFGGQLQVNS